MCVCVCKGVKGGRGREGGRRSVCVEWRDDMFKCERGMK